jgi:hypothetical protein
LSYKQLTLGKEILGREEGKTSRGEVEPGSGFRTEGGDPGEKSASAIEMIAPDLSDPAWHTVTLS